MSVSAIFLTLALLQSSPALEQCDYAAFVDEQQSKRQELALQARQLIETSQELSNQRLAISRRLVELSEGKHRLKGIVDPNYSADTLRGRDHALSEQLNLLRQRGELLRAEASLLELDAETFQTKCGDQALQSTSP